ncbi:MAG TPA: hypothetical protein VI977_03170 [archaeon]|nr:hypothetical protein [archaeon]
MGRERRRTPKAGNPGSMKKENLRKLKSHALKSAKELAARTKGTVVKRGSKIFVQWKTSEKGRTIINRRFFWY